ncbi:MAG: ribose 5-phosphate isomerase B [Magnetococcales bacterium]|nr:ribose 5-phosphate isomerase B [Magnetococcales bacterium]MBF0149756.1 ribose 5-phosphate isomerase B [Magnetococcales bacterium]
MSQLLIACDHGAWSLKDELVKHLRDKRGLEIGDLGVNGPDSVDYPAFAAELCRRIGRGEAQRGILLCGTGLGMSMAANRFKGIRAALCHDEFTARMSRQHNDANVLVIGGRVTGPGLAIAMIDVWLAEPFEGGRHQRRIDALDTLGPI